MMRPFPISQPELLRRRVLFAVALTDPLTGMLVSSGMRVSVDQLESPPIVNHSGHFVWLAEDGAPADKGDDRSRWRTLRVRFGGGPGLARAGPPSPSAAHAAQ